MIRMILTLGTMYFAIKCYEAAYLLHDVVFGVFGVIFTLISLVIWMSTQIIIARPTKEKGGD